MKPLRFVPFRHLPATEHLRPLLTLAGALLYTGWLAAPIVHAQESFAWNTAEYENVPYISLEDIRSFYKFSPLQRPEDTSVRAVGNNDFCIEFGPDTREIRIQGIRLRLSRPFRLNESGDLMLSQVDVVKLLDPILRPVYISDRKPAKMVIIDPGHGGQDTGVCNERIREADYTLLMSRMLARELRRRKYDVYITQETNSFLSDQQRAELSAQIPNAIFVSLHLNTGRSDMKGVQTYTVTPAAPNETERLANKHDAANIALAYAVHSALVVSAGVPDAGIRRAHYSVLSSVACPGILVELGYATNEEDCARLNNESHRLVLTAAIADGIDTYSAAMKPEATMHPAGTQGFTPPDTYQEAAPSVQHDDATDATKEAKSSKKTGKQTEQRRSRSSS